MASCLIRVHVQGTAALIDRKAGDDRRETRVEQCPQETFVNTRHRADPAQVRVFGDGQQCPGVPASKRDGFTYLLGKPLAQEGKRTFYCFQGFVGCHPQAADEGAGHSATVELCLNEGTAAMHYDWFVARFRPLAYDPGDLTPDSRVCHRVSARRDNEMHERKCNRLLLRWNATSPPGGKRRRRWSSSGSVLMVGGT